MRHWSVMALVMILGPVSAGVGMPSSFPSPTDLGSLGGTPFPVNLGGFGRAGTVVGGTMKVGIGQVPFAWTSAEGLHVISSQIGFSTGANDIGQVVGFFSPPSAATTGFMWTDSTPPTLVAITNPSAGSVTPHFVNHNGLVAGEMDLNNGERHAFTWSASGGLKDIGWLGGSQLWVTGITSGGLVVGYAENASGNTHAFSWKSGPNLKDLGTLGGLWSYASGANDSGKIVGYSQDASFQTQAFTYQNGKMTLLASPTGTGAAYAVNSGGTVVGSSLAGSALVWSSTGQATTIPGVDIAVDINDNGQVAAYEFSAYNQEPRTYFWSAATGLVDAGSDDDYYSQPLGITNDGRIVSLRVDWSNISKAYIWKSARSRSLLDGLAGGFSRALKVNSAGQVTGVSRTPLGYDRAFIWSSSTGMVEVPAPLHCHSTPVAINSTGQILGSTYTGTTILTSGSSFFWPGTGTAFSNLGLVSCQR